MTKLDHAIETLLHCYIGIDGFQTDLEKIGFMDEYGKSKLSNTQEHIDDFFQSLEESIGYVESEESMTTWSCIGWDLIQETDSENETLEAYRKSLIEVYGKDWNK